MSESQAEKVHIREQLFSKSERLEKVEELVQRLEGSLKLIESENAIAKSLEMSRLEEIQRLKIQLDEARCASIPNNNELIESLNNELRLEM